MALINASDVFSKMVENKKRCNDDADKLFKLAEKLGYSIEVNTTKNFKNALNELYPDYKKLVPVGIKENCDENYAKEIADTINYKYSFLLNKLNIINISTKRLSLKIENFNTTIEYFKTLGDFLNVSYTIYKYKNGSYLITFLTTDGFSKFMKKYYEINENTKLIIENITDEDITIYRKALKGNENKIQIFYDIINRVNGKGHNINEISVNKYALYQDILTTIILQDSNL